jgi:hypothetical protein
MRLGPILIPATLCLPLLTGCSLQQTASPKPEPAVKLTGSVHGGQQAIVGAHVYLFAANTTGYGQPSVSLLNAASTGTSDSLGAYVVTDSNGAFTITGDYSCTPNTQVYLYALGGNPGAGVNSAAGLLTTLGNCPSSGSFLASFPLIQVNEVTTVAAAYAMAGFATDATHVSSSGTPLALTGIANAFANAANLADITTGSALAVTPSGNGVVPRAEINTLADILAACINSTDPGSTPCSTLFANALSGGASGSTPSDTATAIINIAHNPGVNVPALNALVTATAPFQPTNYFSHFALYLSFTDPTISRATGQPGSIGIDGSGNVWTVNAIFSGPPNTPPSSYTVTKLSPSGSVLSGATGYVVGNDITGSAAYLAIDQTGNAWLTGTSHIYKISSSGTVSTFLPDEGSAYGRIAIDGPGNVWSISTGGTPSLIELSPGGTDLHFNSTAPIGINGLAISNSGIAWTAGYPNLLYGTTIANGTGVNVTVNGSVVSAVVALDATGDPWVMDPLTQYAYDGSTSTWSVASSNANGSRPSDMAVDGSGTFWLASDYSDGALSGCSNNGSGINCPIYYGSNGSLFPLGITIDASGDIWTRSGQAIIEYIGTATPVVTPLSVGVKNNTLGTRP